MDQTGRRFVRIRRLYIFILRFVSRASRAKPAFIVTFVEGVTALGGFRFGHATPELTYSFTMEWISRAHEDVVATVLSIEAEGCGHLLVIADDVVRLFLRSALVEFR